MRRDEAWLEEVCRKNRARGIEVTAEDIEEQLDLIERGFDDIEHRIANLDKEHTRYIRATVTRIHYLLNREDSMKGLVIRILSHLSEAEEKGGWMRIWQGGRRLNVSQFTVSLTALCTGDGGRGRILSGVWRGRKSRKSSPARTSSG